MILIQQRAEFFSGPGDNRALALIEEAGRVCYKSEGVCETYDRERAIKFVNRLIDSKHESVLEHVSFGMKFITDRGVTHEIVRHRLASYSQESTRYCNYAKDKFGKQVSFIVPVGCDPQSDPKWMAWELGCQQSEMAYFAMLEQGATPQEARTVLNNSLKTEIVMTCNLREWRHFFTLRCAPAAHPQMRDLALKALRVLWNIYGPLFDDIAVQFGVS